jgi:hypothetical protein
MSSSKVDCFSLIYYVIVITTTITIIADQTWAAKRAGPGVPTAGPAGGFS